MNVIFKDKALEELYSTRKTKIDDIVNIVEIVVLSMGMSES